MEKVIAASNSEGIVSAAEDVSAIGLVRLAGLPLDLAKGLSTSSLRVAVRLLLDASSAFRARAAMVSTTLYDAIGRESSAARRSALIRIRRDVFNGRTPRADDLLAVDERADEAALVVKELMSAIHRVSAMRGLVRNEYAHAMIHSRSAIRRGVGDYGFRNGLTLSSASLSHNVDRYLATAPTGLTARGLRVERGLLRYLTRASAKATPFASFCSIVPLVLSDGPGTGVVVRGSTDSARSVARLNKAIYGRLWDHLKSRTAVTPFLVVEPNPTAKRRGDQFAFLATVRGREVLQRVACTDAVRLVFGLASESTGAKMGQLIERLVTDERLESSLTEATQFVDALIAVGLLRFRSPLAAHGTDWVRSLLRIVKSVDDEHARAIAAALPSLQSIADCYSQADPTTRMSMTEELRDQLQTLIARLGVSPGRELKTPIFEDCGASLEISLGETSGMPEAIASLSRFAGRVCHIAHSRGEMATMRHFFETTYGGCDAVPLLKFFEDYYRGHFRDHLIRQRRAASGDPDPGSRNYNWRNPFSLPVIDALHSARASWTEAIRTSWAMTPTAQEIHIAPTDIAPPIDVPERSARCPQSLSVFCDLIPIGNSRDPARLITKGGRMFLGFGKYFSRFLHVLPESVTADLRARNGSVADAILAEIAGDSNFNGNLHPRLVSHQIVYPTGEGDTEHEPLYCDDLFVRRDPDDNIALMLADSSTGRQVVPLDLGFLTLLHRPPLYQLLARFSPFGGHEIHLPTRVSAADEGQPVAEITYRPRLVYDQAVVLARRMWTVPRSLYPTRAVAELSEDYFERVNEWRAGLGIPETIYVRVLQRRQQRKGEAAAATTHMTETQERAAKSEELAAGSGPRRRVPSESAEAPRPKEAGEALDQRGLGMVDTVSVDGSRAGGLGGQQPSRDLAKPQYIDFSSPLLVDLFGRLGSGLQDCTFILEEEYPAVDDRLRVDRLPYATELLLQLDWPSQRIHEAGDDR